MDLTAVIAKARNIRDKYIEASTTQAGQKISVEDLRQVIEKETGSSIAFYAVDSDFIQQEKAGVLNRDTHATENVRLKGRLDRYRDHAKIFFPECPRITKCEQRFVAVKEMSHLLIDSPKTFTNDVKAILKLVEEIVYPPSLTISELSEAHQSEILAEVVALELLLPWNEREACNDSIASGTDPVFIAKQFKVPVKKLEWILSQHQALKGAHKIINELLESERHTPHPEEDGEF